ncbi:UNVERIFIED_CONTAM: hypothetical protein GTU68_029362 [Idotea baltica]|nr:hypothetical protein [Idotea baltica]
MDENNDSKEGVQTWIADSSPEEVEDDIQVQNLRPENFNEFVGQKSLINNLSVACRAAKKRGESMDHLLLYGPPGLGKTSLSRIVSKELGVGFKSSSGPIIERPGDLAAILTSLEKDDVFFIDEIHRLPHAVEEVLYPAMEDYELDIIIGQGPSAKSVKIDLKPFTLIGATTRTGLLTSPLRDRFGIVMRLEHYSTEELGVIVKRSSSLLDTKIEKEASYEIAKRSRGTPRIANRLLKRVRDFAEDQADGEISLEVAQKSLDLLEIDDLGLNLMDRKLLEIIINDFSGGPVGVETIAASIGEEKDTIEDVYEPFLIQKGFLLRTKRGREVTLQAYEHLKIEPKDKSLKLI